MVIKAAHLHKSMLFNHQTGTRYRRYILGIAEPSHISQILIGLAIVSVSGRSVCPKTDNHTGMLNCLIGIEKLDAHRTDILTLAVHEHLLNPVNRYYLRIVVEQDNELSVGTFHAVIVHSRIVEFPDISNHPDIAVALKLLVIIFNVYADRIVLNHHNLVVIVGSFLKYRADTASQILHVVPVRYNDRHSRM